MGARLGRLRLPSLGVLWLIGLLWELAFFCWLVPHGRGAAIPPPHVRVVHWLAAITALTAPAAPIAFTLL